MKILCFLKAFVVKVTKTMRFLLNIRYYVRLEKMYFDLEKQYILMRRINQKLKNSLIESPNKKTIRVIFLVQEQSLFPVFESVIEKLSKNKIFECFVILTPQYFCNEWQKKSYFDLKKYFQARNIEAVDGVISYSEPSVLEEVLDLQDLNPDCVFYTCPYMEDYHPLHKCNYVDSFALICYIPYGFLLAEQSETQYHQDIHRLAYRIYCETDFHQKNYGERRDAQSQVITTGYTKFDLIETPFSNTGFSFIKSNFKKIIVIAPHWSISDISSITRYGTFDRYYVLMENLLKHFSDIYFVFKPHPSLSSALSRKGILSLEEYEELIERWGRHKNFELYEGADYFDYFSISDALITDSVSFLAEYVLFQKPLLLLMREDQSPYNEIGRLLVDAFYKASQEADIFSFIQKVVVSGEDSLTQSRAQLKKLIKPLEISAASYIEKDLTTKFY